MKKKLLLTILLFPVVNICISQTSVTVTKETYTVCSLTKPIYIQGHLYNQSKNPNNYLPFGSVIIKGTRIGSQADSLGYYSIDITAIADTAKGLTLISSYPGLHTKEIVIKNKVTKTVEVDFVLITRPDCELPDIGDGKKKVKSKKNK